MVIKKNVALSDRQQNFWQMASIQIAGFGIPTLLVGAHLGKVYGTRAALLSIGVGNLILWLIGLAIVGMTIKERKNAISNLDICIGKYGRLLGGLVLSFAFLFWYTLQTKITVAEMKISLSSYVTLSDTFEIRIGTFFGFLTVLSFFKLFGSIRKVRLPL